MEKLTELCEDTSGKLGRELKGQEIAFLKWVYEKHMLEVNAKKPEPLERNCGRTSG